jgi:hypothetical protein
MGSGGRLMKSSTRMKITISTATISSNSRGNRARSLQPRGGSAGPASALSSAGKSGELKISSIGSSFTEPSF